MQNNLIPQISHGRAEVKGEETNRRTARGSKEDAVEGKDEQRKTSVHMHTRRDAAVRINSRVIHTPIDQSTPASLAIRTSDKVLIMESFMP